MKRKASLKELEARAKAGDRSFVRWLQSSTRREELAIRKHRPTNRFLSGYVRKTFSNATDMNLVLDVGCGLGNHASSILQVETEGEVRYVGMDADPMCIKHCRKQFGGLPSFQFHTCDYLNMPHMPRRFDYVVISHILDSLPTYVDLISHVWHRCAKGLIVLFDGPLSMGLSDHIQEDAIAGRLYSIFSSSRVTEFCRSLAKHVDAATVYSDNSQEREHVVLMRQADNVPDLSGIHRYAENGSTFPFYEEGIL